MQCYEFEIVLRYLSLKLAEFDAGQHLDRCELADILIDHGVTTVDRLPDVVSLARNLQAGIRLAA